MTPELERARDNIHIQFSALINEIKETSKMWEIRMKTIVEDLDFIVDESERIEK